MFCWKTNIIENVNLKMKKKSHLLKNNNKLLILIKQSDENMF